VAEASVVVRVDASKAIKPLNDVGAAAASSKQKLNNLGGAARKTQGAFGKLKTAGSSLQGVLAGLGAGAALQGLIGAGVEAERTSKRLNLLSESFGESERLAEFAAAAAEKFALGNTSAASAVADLYGRLRPAGVSLKDIETVFNGVNVAAARMNLTAADTDGVLLQLSQALGSGTLQGDEFRSVMERLPAVGQALAKSLGVSVGELKKLGSDGKLTTDVIIKALQGLAGQDPPPIDAYKEFQKALADLRTTLGESLLPLFTPLVQITTAVLKVFNSLPGPIQAIIAGAIGIAGAVVILVPIIAAIVSGFQAFAALGIGATIAGWLPAIASIGTTLGGLLPIIAGIFTGPVGWIALLAGAGVAIYAFRDQIGEFLGGILQPFKDVFSAIGRAIRAPFEAVVGFIKGIINNVLGFIENAINGAINSINNLIQGVNRISSALGIPAIPSIPNVKIPKFAEGGMVNGAQLAVVGEAGPEYIVPAGKAQGFAQNILAGVRGPGAIPAYAEGGYVGPVNITTGPVMQQGGTNYVTMAQFEAGIRDVASAVTRGGRSYGARRYSGVS
jgi:tape measure domain-containing protein